MQALAAKLRWGNEGLAGPQLRSVRKPLATIDIACGAAAGRFGARGVGCNAARSPGAAATSGEASEVSTRRSGAKTSGLGATSLGVAAATRTEADDDQQLRPAPLLRLVMRRQASPPRRPAKPAKPPPRAPEAAKPSPCRSKRRSAVRRSKSRAGSARRSGLSSGTDVRPALDETAGSWRRSPCLAQAAPG